MAENCAWLLLKTSPMAVLFPTKVAELFRPGGGTSHKEDMMLLGIHGAKKLALRSRVALIAASTSYAGTEAPRNMQAVVRYTPRRGSHATIA